MARLGPVYGIRASGEYPGEEPDDSIPTMADRYTRLLRNLPAPPTLLVGWSLGGVLAWEMAGMMSAGRNQSQDPPGLVLIDSSPSTWPTRPAEPAELRSAILRAAAESGARTLEAIGCMVDAHADARSRFVPTRRYAGRVLLIAGKRDRACGAGWEELADDLTVRDLLGGHFDMLSRQNLPALARHITEFLNL
jgi:thioesterase domain-containing protein